MRLAVSRLEGVNRLMRWLIYTVLLIGLLAGTGVFLMRSYHPGEAQAQETLPEPDRSAEVQVEVAHPQKGGADRTTVQPGSVQAFESVQLYAGVSGYLKTLNVDIGDRVTKGQILAQVDVP